MRSMDRLQQYTHQFLNEEENFRLYKINKVRYLKIEACYHQHPIEK